MMEINPAVIAYILTVILAITVTVAGTGWRIAKGKISDIRGFIDSVDDALYDDEVSEDEFRMVFNLLKTIIKK